MFWTAVRSCVGVSLARKKDDYLVFCNLILPALFRFNRVTCVGRIPPIFDMFPFLPPFSLLWILFAGLGGKRGRSRSFTACAAIRSMFRIPTIIRTICHFPLRVVHLSEPARFWPAGINRKRKTAHVSLEASQARNPLNNRIKVRIHGAILRAILRAIPELHRVSTPKICCAQYCSSRISSYFCNIARNKFLRVSTICSISCNSVTQISVFSQSNLTFKFNLTLRLAWNEHRILQAYMALGWHHVLFNYQNKTQFPTAKPSWYIFW